MQFEKQAEILESVNANLASKLGAYTQAGSALKKYADQLAYLYHNAPCSYYLLDPDGVFIQVNDSGLKWLDRTCEKVVGKMRFTDLLTPASGKTFLESYQHFKEGGWLRDLQLEIAREDGASLSVPCC